MLQVVRAPVVAAGNSIGGFISTSLAADYPQLVAGLVLLNSAGGANTHSAKTHTHASAKVNAQGS